MATKAISADVKAANSKLAQYLRRREEEEMILQIGKRKPKQLEEKRLPGGRARWHIEPDWKAPTPMIDRPRTVDGSTSFHFSYIPISKQGVPTVNGQPVDGAFGKVRNTALDHSKYIERDGAAELQPGADHAAYIERDGAAEMLDPAALISEAVERTIAHVINETPMPDEAELLGIEATAPEGIPSVFSNISDDPFERQEFWRAVERIEREPKSHQIILEPDVAPEWWAELETTHHLDPDFKSHALNVAEAYRQHIAAQLEGVVQKPFEAEPYPVTSEQAGRLIQDIQRMAHYNDYAPPFEFKSGRGGRVQLRFVAELPHEVSATDRALITQNFCDHLATLVERRRLDGTPYKTGMMYTAVIHAPDSHNDSRNYHLHIVAYDRPCRFMPELGQWDFEVEKRYNHKGEDRVSWPHRQDKIAELTRIPENGQAETMGINAIPALRAKYAEINNKVLKARGIKRKLDPRKYTEMGIDRTPTEHLGTKAAALESIGVATTVGQLNAIAIWSDSERSIRRQAVRAAKTYNTSQAELDALARSMTAADPNHPSLRQFRQLMIERQRLIADVAEDREGIMTFDHLEAKAKSRAIRTRQTCLQFLADIENGKADRSTKMMKLVIQDRWKEAQAHIASIDEALAPHRDALTKAARDIEQREQRILEIDAALAPLRAVLEARVGEAGRTTAAATPRRPAASKSTPDPQSTITPPAAEKEAASNEASESTAEAAGPKAEATPTDKAATDEAVEVEPAEVAPPSIKGQPIIEPTIAPRPEVGAEELELDQGTPEGLEPLRPMEAGEEPAAEPMVIVPNIDEPTEAIELTAGPAEQTPSPAEPEISAAEAVDPTADVSKDAAAEVAPDPQSEAPAIGVENTPAAEAEPASPEAAEPPPPAVETESEATPVEPKIDRRRKQEDPSLFPLPIQEPPIKPGTSKAAYADFDQLVVRVMNDRIPIVAERQSNGTIKFKVPSLTTEEQAVLQSSRFAHRANQRLGAIHDKQKQEIQRVIRWISSQGQNPEMLRLENRSATLGEGVRQSVRTMFKHWGRHEDVINAIRAENARRLELAKAQEAEVQAPAPVVDRDLEERRREAEQLYPTPDQAFTETVAEFIQLLRSAASEDQLRDAAEKIRSDPRAREDINRHNVELATAYQQYVEDTGPQQPQRGRGF